MGARLSFAVPHSMLDAGWGRIVNVSSSVAAHPAGMLRANAYGTWTASIWHIEELVIIVDSGRTGGRLATDEIDGTGPRSSGRESDLSGRVSRRRDQNQLHPLRWISPETRSSSYYQAPMTRAWLLPMTTLGQRARVSRWLLRWLGPCW